MLGATVAGTLFLGQPWIVGAAVAVVGGLNYALGVVQKNYIESNLTPHERSYEFSPKLGEISDDLYAKTGLSPARHPLYDFAPDENATHEKAVKGVFAEVFDSLFGMMAKTHNAAAMRFGKPVIIVSKPLLELLNDEEERAVLAHEFTHAKAGHSWLGLPQRLTSGVAQVTSGLTRIFEAVTAGLIAIGVALGTQLAVGFALAFGLHARAEKGYRNKFDEILTDQSNKKIINEVGTLVGVGIISLFKPIFLPIYAATVGIDVTAKIMSSNFSKDMEFQADRGAVALGADPLALATALRKMQTVNELSIKGAMGGEMPKKGFLSKTWKMMTATHPSVDARVKRLGRMAKKQGRSAEDIEAATKGKIVIAAEHMLKKDVIEMMLKRM